MPRSGAEQRLIFRGSPLKRLTRRALPKTGVGVASAPRPASTGASGSRARPDEARAFAAVYREDVRRAERLPGHDLSVRYS